MVAVEKLKKTLKTADLSKLEQQAEKGIECLKRITSKSNDTEDVLETETKIYLTFGLVKMNTKQNLKPVKIMLRNSIHENDTVCIIVKDPQSEWKEKLAGLKVDKIIGISKLRAKYKPFEAKRQLCASYDLFLSDDRVIELLPKMLGKTFFKTVRFLRNSQKKQPVPIDMKSGKFKKEIDIALASTVLVFNLGTCW
jgi:ribosome biogenesis protein UTP30